MLTLVFFGIGILAFIGSWVYLFWKARTDTLEQKKITVRRFAYGIGASGVLMMVSMLAYGLGSK